MSAPARPRRFGAAAATCAVVALFLLPAATLGGSTSNPSVAQASTGLWAWGAFENASYRSEYVGAYSDSLNLTSGNLSQSRATVAEVVADRALYEAFSVVNATAPTTTTREIVDTSVAIANYSAIVEVVGTLPAVGFYAPGAAVPLVNVTAVYYVSVVEISVYVAYANFSLNAGVFALQNEHVEDWVAANDTSIAYHWPGYVNHPNGSTTVTSTTEAAVAVAWAADSFTATFTPALPLSESPLSVGKSWNATTTAKVVGWAADASASAVWNGVTNTSAHNAGGSSLNTTATIGFRFDVVASNQIVYANGTTGTGYTIAATENGSSSGSYTLWDGLVVLPGGSTPSPPPMAPPSAAAPLVAQAPYAAPPTTSQAVVGSAGLPIATDRSVSSTISLSTAPLSTSEATGQVRSTPAPAEPTGTAAPAVTQAPTLTGTSTTPTTNPPGGSPPSSGTSPPSAGTNPPTGPVPTKARGPPAGIAPWVLAGALAVMVVATVGVELALARRTR